MNARLILLIASIVVFILTALGVDLGITDIQLLGVGLALFAGAHV